MNSKKKIKCMAGWKLPSKLLKLFESNEKLFFNIFASSVIVQTPPPAKVSFIFPERFRRLMIEKRCQF